MSDLLTLIGQWIDSRVRRRGFWYRTLVLVGFAVVAALFVRDIAELGSGE